jgi:hypothetical protein
VREVITEFGPCCTFNLIPDLTGPLMEKVWTPETGYPGSPQHMMGENRRLLEVPHRTDIAGMIGGLSLIVDLQVSGIYLRNKTKTNF